MASFNKYQVFVKDLGDKVHDLRASGDTLKVLLSNTAPNVSTHTVKADVTEIAAGNGYSAGGSDTQNDYTASSGTGTCTGVDIVYTASGGTIGPFRYAILYNSTPAAGPLIGYWDYGSGVTLQNGDSFTVDFGASMFTLT